MESSLWKPVCGERLERSRILLCEARPPRRNVERNSAADMMDLTFPLPLQLLGHSLEKNKEICFNDTSVLEWDLLDEVEFL